MKTIIRSKLLIGIFSILLLGLPALVGAEIVDKVIETELAVPAGVTINTKGPITPSINISGTISSDAKAGSYTLKGRHGELLLKIDRRFNVRTWDQPRLKVKLTVSAELLDPSKEAELMNALQAEISDIQAAAFIKIDCLAGLDRITIRNGFFRGDDNTMTLRNGRQYKFKYIAMKAELTIPMDSNFEMESEFVDVVLGHLDGKATIELNGGFVNSSYLKELECLARTSEIRVVEVESAKVSAYRSTVNIAKAKTVSIGQLALTYSSWPGIEGIHGLSLRSTGTDASKNKFSVLSKYQLGEVGQLDFFSSLKDKVQIDKVQNLKVANVAFSELNVFKLLRSMDGVAEFGNINIYAVDKENFETLNFASTFGSLLFFSAELDNVDLELDNRSNAEETKLLESNYRVKESVQIGLPFKLLNEQQSVQVYQKGIPNEGQNPKLSLTCTYCELKIN